MNNMSESLERLIGYIMKKEPRSGSTATIEGISVGEAIGYPSIHTLMFHGAEKKAIPFAWKHAKGTVYIKPHEYNSPHIIIAGASGNGKSTLLKKLISGLASSGTNILLFDSDSEHYDIISAVNGKTIDPFKDINIFALDGLSAGERIQELTSIFSDVFNFGYLQSNSLHSCIRYAYSVSGMRSIYQANIENVPSMETLVRTINTFIANSRTAAEKSRLYSILNRLGSLNLGHGDSSLDGINDLFEGVVSIPLRHVKSPYAKRIIMHELLQRLYSRMQSMPITHKLSNYIIIDELDFVISDYDSQTGIIKKIVREGRKYGIGIIVSTHMAISLPKDMVENSSCIITFGSPDPSERRYMASVMAHGDPAMEKFLYGDISFLQKYHFLLSCPEFALPVKITIKVAKPLENNNHDYQNYASENVLKRPMRKEEALKLGFTEEQIESLKKSGKISSSFSSGSEWLMTKNPSLSIGHELGVNAICSWLSANGIENRAIDNSAGPDVVAYAYGNKMALEYETGKKSASSTSRMLAKRTRDYGFVVVIVDEKAYGFYKSAMEKAGILIISDQEIKK